MYGYRLKKINHNTGKYIVTGRKGKDFDDIANCLYDAKRNAKILCAVGTPLKDIMIEMFSIDDKNRIKKESISEYRLIAIEEKKAS